MNMERVLVVGASGFIGGALLRELRKSHSDSIGASQKPNAPFIHSINYLQTNWLQSLIEESQPTAIVFLMRFAYGERSKHDFEPHFSMFKDAIYLALPLLRRLRKVIFIGSASEFGRSDVPFVESDEARPIDAYGIQKRIETSFFLGLREEGINSTVIRPTSVYGPGQIGQMFTPMVLKAISMDSGFLVRNPLAMRDFLYIDDLVEALKFVIQTEESQFELFHLSSNFKMSMQSYACLIQQIFRLREGFFDFKASVDKDAESKDCLLLDSNLFRQTYGWVPKTDIENGLKTIQGNLQ
jgi:nucleoside-diphosphate-sugar epimerase